MADIFFWLTICVAGTAIPLALDLIRSVLPPHLRFGRLVASWHRPVLLSMVTSLCVWAYHLFWVSVLPYSHAPFTPAWSAHAVAISLLWLNTVWNYAACAAIDPGFVREADGDGDGAGGSLESARRGGKAAAAAAAARDGAPSVTGARYCSICGGRVALLDHHCPFTGGCVGAHNYRFFALFCLHAGLGCVYATALSARPFRECVLWQCSVPALGLRRTPPPDAAACAAMGARSLLVVPAAVVAASLTCLGALHALLLVNGLTTAQLARRMRTRGAWRSVRDLLALHGEVEVDKWALLWGRPAAAASTLHRARILLLPSLPPPERRRWSPGVAQSRAWLGAAALLAAALLLAPALAGGLEALAGGAKVSTVGSPS